MMKLTHAALIVTALITTMSAAQAQSFSHLNGGATGLINGKAPGFVALNPQPIPPQERVMLNPQPIPPGERVGLNPQPIPPKQAPKVFR